LIAADTGVRKRLDGYQMAWFEDALERARGKFKLVLLGHPLYACGQYRAAENADFRTLHELLRRHEVQVVMAGDTHDLEYYLETAGDGSGIGPQHHFVNGGGGAFLTMGAQLGRAGQMPTGTWAFHPAQAPLVAKIEKLNPIWKLPVWWWTRHLGAWPSSPEWLSAAFDYNVAPFFQSFVEVRVEPSTGRVRVMPWGVHGRLRWCDFQRSASLPPPGEADEALAEWVLELPPSEGL
jgi:3',5'-cyclic AMP phosphodiesterase CpdA